MIIIGYFQRSEKIMSEYSGNFQKRIKKIAKKLLEERAERQTKGEYVGPMDADEIGKLALVLAKRENDLILLGMVFKKQILEIRNERT